MPSDRPREPGPHDLVVPFVFVPHGAPEPTDWMAEHPGWVKFPATIIVRPPHAAAHGTTSPLPPALGTAIAATPESGAVVDGMGEALAQFLGAAMAEAVATAAAAGTVLLYPSQTAPREIDEVHPSSGRDPEHETTEGLRPSPPIPALPGLAPPGALPPPQGVVPTPPLPTSPGSAPATPLPGLPPSRPVQETDPTVFQQDRNEDLKGGLRTNSQRARDAARKADPAVPQALADAEWQAHHLINMAAIREATDLLAEAARAGWRTDDVTNVAPLPATREAQQKLDSAGVKRPVHDSGHRKWNEIVDHGIREIRDSLRVEGLESGTDAYGRRARELLEELQGQLRRKLLKSGRVTQNDFGMVPEVI